MVDEHAGWLAADASARPGLARVWRDDLLEAVFERTQNAMLVVNDARVYVDCNQASGHLLECPQRQIIGRRIEDFTPVENHDRLVAAWPQFLLATVVREGSWEMITAKSKRITVEYRSTANFVPGLHLAVLTMEIASLSPAAATQSDTDKSLSPLEREILGRIAVGQGAARIAAELFISPATVRTHLQNVLVKLGAQTRAHAIALALERGEITVEEIDGSSS